MCRLSFQRWNSHSTSFQFSFRTRFVAILIYLGCFPCTEFDLVFEKPDPCFSYKYEVFSLADISRHCDLTVPMGKKSSNLCESRGHAVECHRKGKHPRSNIKVYGCRGMQCNNNIFSFRSVCAKLKRVILNYLQGNSAMCLFFVKKKIVSPGSLSLACSRLLSTMLSISRWPQTPSLLTPSSLRRMTLTSRTRTSCR